MEPARPRPEDLLAVANAEAARAGRGRLKVFFGAAPGVGKTAAMLDEAQQRRAAGLDVVVGWLETHGRPGTAARAEGLPALPARELQHRGATLREFDLDAALARRPGLLLLDELPHSNAPGSRHPKRWQDLEELLEAGLDVYTTLNVQHLESLADVVARVTGVAVSERVPDRLLDAADEVELVDIPPEELLERLGRGEIYAAEIAARARDRYFRRPNLLALRELALRRTAERVDRDVELARLSAGAPEVWATRERLMVAVGPAPQSAELVRAACRMADRLRAPWWAVAVEPVSRERAPQDAARVSETLALAERLGAQTLALRDDRVADALLAEARARNVTRLLVGRPTHPAWRDRLRGSLVDALVRGAVGLDVMVIGAEGTSASPAAPPAPEARDPIREYLLAFSLVAAATGLGVALRGLLTDADEVLLQLLAVVLLSSRVGRGPAFTAAIVSVTAYNYFLVPPYYTLQVSDPRFLVTFAILGAVSLTVSALTLRVRRAAETSRRREQRTAALYDISRAFAAETEASALAREAAAHTARLVGGQAAVWLIEGEALRAATPAPWAEEAREAAVARWCADHAQPAGRGADTLPGAQGLYLPLVGPTGRLGVLGVLAPAALDPEQRQLLDLFATSAAHALARARLVEQAAAAALAAEAERTRASLLAAVSHDLRTPLASIVGTADVLLSAGRLTADDRAVLESLRGEAGRLSRLVQGLLDLTRLSSGAPALQREWWPLSEIVAAVVGRLQAARPEARFAIDVPAELEVEGDALLLGQLLENLCENALKYAPDAPVEVRARATGTAVSLEVLDRGPGVPPGQELRIFERFYRAADARRADGAGLGLAICAAIARVHGGAIRAEARADGPGARFLTTLPRTGAPPAPPGDDR